MSVFDSILKGIGGAPDDVVNLAAKVGIDPAMAEKAIAHWAMRTSSKAIPWKRPRPRPGCRPARCNQIVEHIGGEGSLMEFANMLDRDGDGNPLDDIAGMAKGLFGELS